MIKTITQDEFVTHFENVFFATKTQRIDVEFMAGIHKDEQETEREKNKNHPMF